MIKLLFFLDTHVHSDRGHSTIFEVVIFLSTLQLILCQLTGGIHQIEYLFLADISEVEM
jgi:hypothetical protein